METKTLYTKENPNGSVYPADFQLPGAYESRAALFAVHPELDDTPLPPPPPTLEEVRTAKLAEINAGYSAAMAALQAGYPAEEVLSWERQAAQARDLMQNPAAEAAFVRGLAATKQISVEELCARILRNAAVWEPMAASLTGQRQVMEEIANLAKTVEGVQAIKVAYRV